MRSSRCFCIVCAIAAGALALIAMLTGSNSAYGQEKPVSFINDVAPILKENCYACHDAKKRSGKLDMTSWRPLPPGRRFATFRATLRAKSLAPSC